MSEEYEKFCKESLEFNFAGTAFACGRPKGHKGRHYIMPVWEMKSIARRLSELGFKLLEK